MNVLKFLWGKSPKPVLVTIIAMLCYVMTFALMVFAGYGPVLHFMHGTIPDLVVLLGVLIFGVVFGFVGFNLAHGKQWAWWLVIGVFGARWIDDLASNLSLGSLLGIVLPMIMISYLWIYHGHILDFFGINVTSKFRFILLIIIAITTTYLIGEGVSLLINRV